MKTKTQQGEKEQLFGNDTDLKNCFVWQHHWSEQLFSLATLLIWTIVQKTRLKILKKCSGPKTPEYFCGRILQIFYRTLMMFWKAQQESQETPPLWMHQKIWSFLQFSELWWCSCWFRVIPERLWRTLSEVTRTLPESCQSSDILYFRIMQKMLQSYFKTVLNYCLAPS